MVNGTEILFAVQWISRLNVDPRKSLCYIPPQQCEYIDILISIELYIKTIGLYCIFNQLQYRMYVFKECTMYFTLQSTVVYCSEKNNIISVLSNNLIKLNYVIKL